MNYTKDKIALHVAGVLNALFVVWGVTEGTAWALFVCSINFACMLNCARILVAVEEREKQMKGEK